MSRSSRCRTWCGSTCWGRCNSSIGPSAAPSPVRLRRTTPPPRRGWGWGWGLAPDPFIDQEQPQAKKTRLRPFSQTRADRRRLRLLFFVNTRWKLTPQIILRGPAAHSRGMSQLSRRVSEVGGAPQHDKKRKVPAAETSLACVEKERLQEEPAQEVAKRAGTGNHHAGGGRGRNRTGA